MLEAFGKNRRRGGFRGGFRGSRGRSGSRGSGGSRGSRGRRFRGSVRPPRSVGARAPNRGWKTPPR